jgi:hypothetical protein
VQFSRVVQSVGDALELCAVPPRFGRHGEAAWCGQEDTGARAPHSGQPDGSSHSAIARSCVDGPHFLHIYSYVGIDNLPPAETHPAADQFVAIVGNYTS